MSISALKRVPLAGLAAAIVGVILAQSTSATAAEAMALVVAAAAWLACRSLDRPAAGEEREPIRRPQPAARRADTQRSPAGRGA